MQFFVIFIANNKIEITTGKLKTVISTLLLLAFDAIPESSVREDENPQETNKMVTKNNPLLLSGFEIKRKNNKNPAIERTEQSKKL